jgi:hypothetical protein
MVGTCCAKERPVAAGRDVLLRVLGVKRSDFIRGRVPVLREQKNRFALLKGRDTARPYPAPRNVRLLLVGTCCCASLV